MSGPVRKQYQIFIDRPPQAVFDFHINPRNLARLSPEEAREEAETDAEIPTGVGSRLQFRARRGPVPRRMEVEMTEWNPPHGFAERQVSGPFASWTHKRRFAPFQAGTLMTDTLEYEPIAGPLGVLADKLFLAKNLDTLFAHRHKEAKRLLEQIGRIKGREG